MFDYTIILVKVYFRAQASVIIILRSEIKAPGFYTSAVNRLWSFILL